MRLSRRHNIHSQELSPRGLLAGASALYPSTLTAICIDSKTVYSILPMQFALPSPHRAQHRLTN